MALITKAVRGTGDVLPSASYGWRYIEDTAMSVARDFGYHEIRTPVFEHTELFQRSVGETTDVVQKEMYTFNDKGGRSITLRPEGTAGVARAALEHGFSIRPCQSRPRISFRVTGTKSRRRAGCGSSTSSGLSISARLKRRPTRK